MSNQLTTNQEFHWQGRHDAEDGALGKRVHHVIKQIQVDELQPIEMPLACLVSAVMRGLLVTKDALVLNERPI